MDLNALTDFQLVATHGGFGRASRASGRSKATLSRRIAEFEEALGVRLIERGARSLELTDAGRLLLERADGPMRELAEALAEAVEGMEKPRGQLRIAAPLVFSQMALGGILARFQARYPEVQVEAVAEDRFVDLVEEHFDLTIRINPRKDSALVGRCFARDRLLLVAAPSLRPPPKNAAQPFPTPAVVMPSYRDGDLWSAGDRKMVVEPQPVLRLSSLLMVRDAAAAGAGVALLPQSLAQGLIDDGKLGVWGIVGEEVELWALHTSRRLQSPKVRVFVDFIAAQYPGGWFVV
ncbi:LysR family transcriptional regulator [Herbaspirillum robiniae]|uniref:LysR family transcriptional regulator n=1 Tax=Herbaspirillum robiniae TaxID=2014887 RepID=A0A246WPA9_9BURK|nr:LysR family transcriptional regulator [Herbaspirillum robiniae]OWY28203.1 LysR family transcriptional regulator [Herbaspirillum robiniae]